jgi:peptide-methionine (S)-S-oxide reductase
MTTDTLALRKLVSGVCIMLISMMAAMSCDRPTHAATELPLPKSDLPPATQPSIQTAVFAGGCFWCTEAVFQSLRGVEDVTSGYAGDSKSSANYERVSSGDTKHAEAIRITFDASKITFGQLLRVFFASHDPTTKDRQGPDTGHQYRSAVFYANDDQKRVAESYIQQLDEAKVFSKPIVTTIEPLTEFYPAESYHQDYVNHHPENPYIQQWALPKLKKVQQQFRDQLKTSTTEPTK